MFSFCTGLRHESQDFNMKSLNFAGQGREGWCALVHADRPEVGRQRLTINVRSTGISRQDGGSVMLLLEAFGLQAQFAGAPEDCAGENDLHGNRCPPPVQRPQLVIEALEGTSQLVTGDPGVIGQLAGHLLYVNLQR